MNHLKIFYHYLKAALTAVTNRLQPLVARFFGWYQMVPREKQMTKEGLLHDAAVIVVTCAFGFTVLYAFGLIFRAAFA